MVVDPQLEESVVLLDASRRSGLLYLDQGDLLTIELIEAVQIVDLAIVLANCWSIHYSTSNQVARCGFDLGQGSFIWSNGASPVVLAEVVGDSAGRPGSRGASSQHSAIGAHCTQHLWVGQPHIPRSTCQEHFEAVFGERPEANEAFADNLNLFMPVTVGEDLHPQFGACSGMAGQAITIRALHSLQVGASLCPLGGGSAPETADDPFWERQNSVENYRPVRLTIRSEPGTRSESHRPESIGSS